MHFGELLIFWVSKITSNNLTSKTRSFVQIRFLHYSYIVSRIAEFILKDEAPNSLAAAISELQTLKDSDPSITTSEDSHPFTECGTFADDIKG